MRAHDPVTAKPVARASSDEPTALVRLSVLAGGADTQPAPVNAAVAWLITMAEAVTITLASLATGIGYSLFALGYRGPLSAFFGTGVLASVLFSGVMRLREGRGFAPRREFEAVADATFVWCGVFIFFALLAFLFKLNGELSRGAILSFFFVGLVSVAAVRALAPRAIAALYHTRQLALDDVLVVGVAGNPAIETLKTISQRRAAPASPPSRSTPIVPRRTGRTSCKPACSASCCPRACPAMGRSALPEPGLRRCGWRRC